MNAAERVDAMLGAMRHRLGFDPVAVVNRARSGRTLKHSVEEAKRLRRLANNKAQAACRRRRMQRGLRGDGRPRVRRWKETVEVLQVATANEGTWVRIKTLRPINRGEKLQIRLLA